jgi:hypothetical protein
VRRFTYRSARSLPILVALISVTLIEGMAFTFLLAQRFPVLAWILVAMNVWGIIWFVADYRALAVEAIEVDDAALRIRVGRRWTLDVARSEVGRVIRPTFRDLPTPGTRDAEDYANFTKPAAANVLIVFGQPVRARGPAGIPRSIRRCGLHLDEPDEFVAELGDV